ncbi:MAG: AraC family transcriptional regulator [Woeseiaceae bacterium]
MRNDHPLGAFLETLDETFTAEALFDQMSDTVFFIKDLNGRYLCVNDTLVKRSGRHKKHELIGQLPSDLFGVDLGRSYEAQDLVVIESGKPLFDKLELHRHIGQDTGWCLTTKIPLRSKTGDVVGLTGLSRDLATPDPSSSDYAQVATAIRFAKARRNAPPSIHEMANAASMSIYQLDRRIKKLFGLTTGQWILKSRIELACELLGEHGCTLADVADECGYADQSTFTRQFKRTTGRTPSAFRGALRCG